MENKKEEEPLGPGVRYSSEKECIDSLPKDTFESYELTKRDENTFGHEHKSITGHMDEVEFYEGSGNNPKYQNENTTKSKTTEHSMYLEQTEEIYPEDKVEFYKHTASTDKEVPFGYEEKSYSDPLKTSNITNQLLTDEIVLKIPETYLLKDKSCSLEGIKYCSSMDISKAKSSLHNPSSEGNFYSCTEDCIDSTKAKSLEKFNSLDGANFYSCTENTYHSFSQSKSPKLKYTRDNSFKSLNAKSLDQMKHTNSLGKEQYYSCCASFQDISQIENAERSSPIHEKLIKSLHVKALDGMRKNHSLGEEEFHSHAENCRELFHDKTTKRSHNNESRQESSMTKSLHQIKQDHSQGKEHFNRYAANFSDLSQAKNTEPESINVSFLESSNRKFMDQIEQSNSLGESRYYSCTANIRDFSQVKNNEPAYRHGDLPKLLDGGEQNNPLEKAKRPSCPASSEDLSQLKCTENAQFLGQEILGQKDDNMVLYDASKGDYKNQDFSQFTDRIRSEDKLHGHRRQSDEKNVSAFGTEYHEMFELYSTDSSIHVENKERSIENNVKNISGFCEIESSVGNFTEKRELDNKRGCSIEKNFVENYRLNSIKSIEANDGESSRPEIIHQVPKASNYNTQTKPHSAKSNNPFRTPLEMDGDEYLIEHPKHLDEKRKEHQRRVLKKGLDVCRIESFDSDSVNLSVLCDEGRIDKESDEVSLTELIEFSEALVRDGNKQSVTCHLPSKMKDSGAWLETGEEDQIICIDCESQHSFEMNVENTNDIDSCNKCGLQKQYKNQPQEAYGPIPVTSEINEIKGEMVCEIFKNSGLSGEAMRGIDYCKCKLWDKCLSFTDIQVFSFHDTIGSPGMEGDAPSDALPGQDNGHSVTITVNNSSNAGDRKTRGKSCKNDENKSPLRMKFLDYCGFGNQTCSSSKTSDSSKRYSRPCQFGSNSVSAGGSCQPMSTGKTGKSCHLDSGNPFRDSCQPTRSDRAGSSCILENSRSSRESCQLESPCKPRGKVKVDLCSNIVSQSEDETFVGQEPKDQSEDASHVMEPLKNETKNVGLTKTNNPPEKNMQNGGLPKTKRPSKTIKLNEEPPKTPESPETVIQNAEPPKKLEPPEAVIQNDDPSETMEPPEIVKEENKLEENKSDVPKIDNSPISKEPDKPDEQMSEQDNVIKTEPAPDDKLPTAENSNTTINKTNSASSNPEKEQSATKTNGKQDKDAPKKTPSNTSANGPKQDQSETKTDNSKTNDSPTKDDSHTSVEFQVEGDHDGIKNASAKYKMRSSMIQTETFFDEDEDEEKEKKEGKDKKDESDDTPPDLEAKIKQCIKEYYENEKKCKDCCCSSSFQPDDPCDPCERYRTLPRKYTESKENKMGNNSENGGKDNGEEEEKEKKEMPRPALRLPDQTEKITKLASVLKEPCCKLKDCCLAARCRYPDPCCCSPKSRYRPSQSLLSSCDSCPGSSVQSECLKRILRRTDRSCSPCSSTDRSVTTSVLDRWRSQNRCLGRSCYRSGSAGGCCGSSSSSGCGGCRSGSCSSCYTEKRF